jgi:hypothetical protein
VGLARGLKEGVIRGSKYKVNWDFLTMRELKELYERVMGYLTEEHYGEYCAVRALFGKDVADRLAKAGDVIGPVPIQ